MEAVGVIAEYNPFHLGHARHIAQTRQAVARKTGLPPEDVPVLCVMPGSWVQRGECALADKWARAALALMGGVDLVLELPLPWALSSAEGFAQGGVDVLRATGVTRWVSFGSESGDLDGLRALAGAMDDKAYSEALKRELTGGCPFAAARQRAAEALCGREAGRLLERPNDNLAVEYLRAMGEEMEPIAIRRRGPAHDAVAPQGETASASMLRELARKGDWDGVDAWAPAGTANVLREAGIAEMRYVERAILAKLRSMDREELAALPDSGVAEGLPDRLLKAAGQAGSLEAFYALAKTRRYAHARLRRLALRAFLGVGERDTLEKPAYLRVLGANGRGQALLKEMKRAASLPILTKTAHIRRLDGEANRQFAMECKATDLYGLCFAEVRPCGLDLRTGPVILP